MRTGTCLGTAAAIGLGLATSCTTLTPPPASSPETASRRETAPRREISPLERLETIIAQKVADDVGPGIRVRAVLEDPNGFRRVRAVFALDHDAYVIVGHLGVDGRLTILFPSTPGDSERVQARRAYQTTTTFAGFTDELRWRSRDPAFRYMNFSARRSSYDGGFGYVFAIATWRPMRVAPIVDLNQWQVLDASSEAYSADPRLAIEDLAEVLAGGNREAYSLAYASYLTTQYGYDQYASAMSYRSGCSYGYRSGLISSWLFGFTSLSSPYGYAGLDYGSPFATYDPLSGCNRGVYYRRVYATTGTTTGPTTPAPRTPSTPRFPNGPATPRDTSGWQPVGPLMDPPGAKGTSIRALDFARPADRPGLFTVDEQPDAPFESRANGRPGVANLGGVERPVNDGGGVSIDRWGAAGRARQEGGARVTSDDADEPRTTVVRDGSGRSGRPLGDGERTARPIGDGPQHTRPDDGGWTNPGRTHGDDGSRAARPHVDPRPAERPHEVDRSSERPRMERPTVERPVERPAAQRPAVERPSVERPSVERPRVERPTPPPSSRPSEPEVKKPLR